MCALWPCLVWPASPFHQPPPQIAFLAQEKDVKSIDAILAALYDVISGPAGQKRNWDRMRTLFLPEGKLVATGIRPDGTTGKRVMSVEITLAPSGPFLEKTALKRK